MSPSGSESPVRRSSSNGTPAPANAPLSKVDQLLAVQHHYSAKAQLLRARPGYVLTMLPDMTARRAGAALRALQNAAADGASTPQLFVYSHEALPQVGHLQYTEVIDSLRERSLAASMKEGARWPAVPFVPKEQTIDFALAMGHDVIDAVRKMCAGMGVDPVEAQRRHTHIFAGREHVRTRNGTITELLAIDAAIQAWSDRAPMGFQLIRPEIASAIAGLENAIPRTGGRPPKESWSWSDEAQERALALQLLLEDLLVHVLATARARLPAFQRALDPASPELAEEEEQKKTEGEKPAPTETKAEAPAPAADGKAEEKPEEK